MFTLVEENYLKTIYHLSENGKKEVSTNALAKNMKNKAASVTDMVKKLSQKGVITYEKYKGVRLLDKGNTTALRIIRKHRLWETFLVEKLGFTWDEVHVIAEQLEHIRSPLLIEKLDTYLGYPKVDPHGHPIPDPQGKVYREKQKPLSQLTPGSTGYIQEVRPALPAFLKYLSKVGISIGIPVRVLEKIEFDGSLEILINEKTRVFISKEAAENLYVNE